MGGSLSRFGHGVCNLNIHFIDASLLKIWAAKGGFASLEAWPLTGSRLWGITLTS